MLDAVHDAIEKRGLRKRGRPREERETGEQESEQKNERAAAENLPEDGAFVVSMVVVEGDGDILTASENGGLDDWPRSALASAITPACPRL